MKNLYFLLLFCFLFSLTGRGEDEYVNGIFITNDNVTYHCKIMIPKDFGQFNEVYLFSKVTIMDSLGNINKYGPGDISGYAFIYQAKKYSYVSKQVEDDGTKLFLWPLHLGKKLNEYYHYTINSANLDKGSMGAISEVYVLEMADTKETISLLRGGSLTENYKSQMRRFFENDKALLTILNKDVKNFHDISQFVKDANRVTP
jgi:hypothetical protein